LSNNTAAASSLMGLLNWPQPSPALCSPSCSLQPSLDFVFGLLYNHVVLGQHSSALRTTEWTDQNLDRGENQQTKRRIILHTLCLYGLNSTRATILLSRTSVEGCDDGEYSDLTRLEKHNQINHLSLDDTFYLARHHEIVRLL
jgi:hypothetical protein